MFSMLWTCAPILVSVISFFTFVMQGKQLTVSIAFTVSIFLLLIDFGFLTWVGSRMAIALFNMIRAPLNVIPAWIVQILQVCFQSKLKGPFVLTTVSVHRLVSRSTVSLSISMKKR